MRAIVTMQVPDDIDPTELDASLRARLGEVFLSDGPVQPDAVRVAVGTDAATVLLVRAADVALDCAIIEDVEEDVQTEAYRLAGRLLGS